jgi:hypothetical protein
MVQPAMDSRCIQAISVRNKTQSKFENLWKLLFKRVKVKLSSCLLNRVQAPRHENVWVVEELFPHQWSVLLSSVSSLIVYFSPGSSRLFPFVFKCYSLRPSKRELHGGKPVVVTQQFHNILLSPKVQCHVLNGLLD